MHVFGHQSGVLLFTWVRLEVELKALSVKCISRPSYKYLQSHISLFLPGIVQSASLGAQFGSGYSQSFCCLFRENLISVGGQIISVNPFVTSIRLSVYKAADKDKLGMSPFL